MKFHLMLATGSLLLIHGALAAEDEKEPQKPTVQVMIEGFDDAATATAGENGAVQIIVGDGNGTIDVGGGRMHFEMLQDAAAKLDPDNPARKHLEQHLLRLMADNNTDAPKMKQHVRSFATSSSQSVITDDQHRISVTAKDGDKSVVVHDLDGNDLFSGPWNTAEDKAKAPPEIREKLKMHAAAVQIETIVNLGTKAEADAPDKPVAKKEKAREQQHRQRSLRDADGRRVY